MNYPSTNSIPSQDEATQVKYAIQQLANRAHAVKAAEREEMRMQAVMAKATNTLQEARDQYDEALEKAVAVFPQLASGFGLNPETVGIGPDGKVHVVPVQEVS